MIRVRSGGEPMKQVGVRRIGQFAVAALTVILSLLAPGRIRAQNTNATLTGRITDPNGSVIAGSEVTVRNVSTGVAVVVKTNEDGLYTRSEEHTSELQSHVNLVCRLLLE